VNKLPVTSTRSLGPAAARAAAIASATDGDTSTVVELAARATAGPGDLVLVTGSLFTVGDAKRVLARI